MYLYIYIANLFYNLLLYQYMCITLNVYIISYIVQHHGILPYKYGAIEFNKHLHFIYNIEVDHFSGTASFG